MCVCVYIECVANRVSYCLWDFTKEAIYSPAGFSDQGVQQGDKKVKSVPGIPQKCKYKEAWDSWCVWGAAGGLVL